MDRAHDGNARLTPRPRRPALARALWRAGRRQPQRTALRRGGDLEAGLTEHPLQLHDAETENSRRGALVSWGERYLGRRLGGLAYRAFAAPSSLRRYSTSFVSSCANTGRRAGRFRLSGAWRVAGWCRRWGDGGAAALLSSAAVLTSTDFCSFTLTTVLIALARAPKRSVERVSAELSSCGEAATTSEVLQLPPRDCCSMRVSFESRNGTWGLPSLSALITFESADSDWLIFFACTRGRPSCVTL
eukprot:COSAG01_NODE_2531_length_7495_cov_6.504191_7_plen_245_part_00